jgi:23S rRNA (uracil1939-C5)-methyltransferase
VKPPGGPTAGARLAELDELELTIERLVAGGEGMARFEGIPVFVPRAAPGDRLRVRLVERRPGYGRAEIVEILAPGPGRREPPCPHFAECGGCDLQHIEDALQLRYKGIAALETLHRLSGLALPPPAEVLGGAAWGYRLRAQVHTRATAAGGAEVGYHARGSRRLVPVERCPVLVPGLERAVTTLAQRLEAPFAPRIDLAAGDDGTIAASPASGGFAGGELRRRVAGDELAFDARCFFQGHAGLIEPLVARVVGEWEGDSAIDLYGGVGLFALSLARRYRSVTLVEGDRIAVRYARKNARLAHAGGLEVVGQAVESWVGRHLPDGAERVVVDPPRDGLALVVRRLLVARAPARLTYVSCHPAALARDLKELADAFVVESLTLVDLFPQTGHVEIVLQLVRRA